MNERHSTLAALVVNWEWFLVRTSMVLSSVSDEESAKSALPRMESANTMLNEVAETIGECARFSERPFAVGYQPGYIANPAVG